MPPLYEYASRQLLLGWRKGQILPNRDVLHFRHQRETYTSNFLQVFYMLEANLLQIDCLILMNLWPTCGRFTLKSRRRVMSR